MKITIREFARSRHFLSSIADLLQIPLPVWQTKPDREKGYRSQFGQDQWIVERVFPGRTTPGYFVEMGAADGLLLSNTHILESRYNWNGILVEPTHQFSKLVQNRTAHCANVCISDQKETTYIIEVPGPSYLSEDPKNTLRSMTINADTAAKAKEEAMQDLPDTLIERINIEDIKATKINAITLNDLFEQHNAPRTIDFLSLDVEGHEYEILKNFSFEKYTFLSIVIERPIKALRSLLKKHAYVPVAKNNIGDLFYLHKSMLKTYFDYRPSQNRASSDIAIGHD